MTYRNQEMMTQIGFEKVKVDVFIDNVCIETVIGSPDFIYDNVALFHNDETNSSDFVYID
jgi:hypothetical protein